MADGKGNIYVADMINSAIRLLQPLGPVSVTAVHDAASNLAGPVAPGEMVVLGGSGLGPQQLTLPPATATTLAAALGGTIVTFDGVPAPIVYTSSTQVAAIVPFEVKGPITQVAVTYLDQKLSPLPIAVTPQAPAIFTADSSGAGQAAALNSDGTLNSPSNPAAAYSTICILMTGEGLEYPAIDGQAIQAIQAPAGSISVTIGNVPAQLTGAFGRSPGVLQVNASVPAGVSGNAPVTMKVGNTFTQPGVTIAVK